MDIMRITGISVTAALAALIMRRMRPEFSIALALCCGAVMLILTLPGIAHIIDGISAFSAKGGVSSATTTVLLKITGISLLTDFAARTCRDAGEQVLQRTQSLPAAF